MSPQRPQLSKSKSLKKQIKSHKQHKQHIHWSTREDLLLKELVKRHGAKKWKRIAEAIKTRNAKQCRERYYGHILKGIVKSPLTLKEDALIMEYRIEMKMGWADMARRINAELNINRTPNQLKNNFNQRLSKNINKSKIAHILNPKNVEPIEHLRSSTIEILYET